MAKFGAMSTPTPGCAATCSRSAANRLAPPGGPHDDMHPTRHTVGDVGRRRIRHRELDNDVGPTEVTQLVSDIEPADELEPIGGLHRVAHRGTHSAARTDHRNLRRHGASVVGLRRPLTPRTRPDTRSIR